MASEAQGGLKGRLKQSVSRWCYSKLTLEQLCEGARGIGLQSVELLGPDEWPVVQRYGLTCAMCNGPGPIHKGWNDPGNHDELVARSEELLPKIAELGMPNMIVFSGNCRGDCASDALDYCAQGLERILPLAERLGVTVCMELLNSKRDHKNYQCDNTPWGVALARRIGHARFRLLYDIYHMQIMEGDVILTLRDHFAYIGHIHTGGVPGRNEIDETQELNYRRIMQELADLGFTGYIGHEFVPASDDPLDSLRKAARLCDV